MVKTILLYIFSQFEFKTCLKLTVKKNTFTAEYLNVTKQI